MPWWVQRRGVPALVALAPFLLFLVVELQRPFPFTTTNDNWSYFLPLMSRVSDAWLHGAPLRVIWELGQGWSPVDSGQVGWLSPLPVLSAIVTRVIGDPLWFLEVNAGVHLLALGALSLWAPPPRLNGGARWATALLLGLAPGTWIVGMNWHDYLTPAPWFVALLGFVWRAVDEDRAYSAKEGVGLVVCALLFFSAGHPQMVVLGCAFLTLFALTLAKSRVVVDVVGRLAVAFLGVVPALYFLSWAAAQAAPVWQQVRADKGLLDAALPRGDGLLSLAFGHAAYDTGTAYFLPLLFVVVVVGAVKQQPRLIVAALFIAVLCVPKLLPQVQHLFVGPFASFRFPIKLTVYAGPIVAALFLHEPARWRVAVAVVVAGAGAVAVIDGNDSAVTLNAAHATGAGGLRDEGKRCLDALGIPPGARFAFVEHVPYERSFSKVPTSVIATFNHAALTLGRETLNVYEPLEPRPLWEGHAQLTTYWRNHRGLDDDDDDSLRREVRLNRLRRGGATWLLAWHKEVLAPLPTTTACDLAAARLPDAAPFLGARPLERAPDGTLVTVDAADAAPVVDVVRDLEWRRRDDGRWQATPGLFDASWPIATVALLVLSLVLVRRPLPFSRRRG